MSGTTPMNGSNRNPVCTARPRCTAGMSSVAAISAPADKSADFASSNPQRAACQIAHLRGIEAGELAVALLILDCHNRNSHTRKESGYGYSIESHNRRRTRQGNRGKILE